MCSSMDCQRAPLDETLVATLHATTVRSFVGMGSVVSPEIGVAMEALIIIRLVWKTGLGRNNRYFSTILPKTNEVTPVAGGHGLEAPNERRGV